MTQETENNLPYYLKLYKNIQNDLTDGKKKKYQKAKVALLSSSTIKGLKEILFVECHKQDIWLDIFEGEYNNYAQEIFDQKSQLYAFEPDLTFLFVDTAALLGDRRFDFYQLTHKERMQLGDAQFEQFTTLINTFKQNCKSKVVLHNFEVPTHSPLGILEGKQEFGLREMVETFNSKLRDIFKGDSQVFVLDYEAFCSRKGKENILDYKMYYLADMKVAMSYLPALSSEYISYIKAYLARTKKCLVLDLDNTLWGGIIGEDGIEGIRLGPTPEGRPYPEFQRRKPNNPHLKQTP